jgi:limonene 1,2-monooxygenase
MVDAMNDNGFSVIGTPDDAARQIERLWNQSGGFGTFLFMGHEWADRDATMRSYELLARRVVPQFQGTLSQLEASHDWAAENRPTFIGRSIEAIGKAIQDHVEDRESVDGDRKSTDTDGESTAAGRAGDRKEAS